ncbi:glycosyltransferase [Solirubrobacter ginsenosidimutans]|uniref:Glycosyltransferase n=1 Tax=Solirubrobacter ginsenosidimutans TaxID=490573 RepID=A0A9X3S1W7_9ACTN|nr:glycosyltransferase [Solirubrobacter ginsenosidimutans]MDA0162869.1 glycosyltransferase [Solirubrobacter ginsenosidimutans]
MRIIFATCQGGGHFQPLVPFARAAQRAGHDVVVAAPGAARGMVERAGFECYALGEPWDRAERWAAVFGPDSPGAVHVVQELFIGLDAYAALPGMLALVHNHGADLIVRETTEFSSTIAAAHFNVPVVAVGPHLDAAIDTDGGLHAIAAPALERLGPYRLDAPVLTLSPFGDAPGVHRFRHPARERVDRSLVYVSFGSEIRSPELFRAIARALAGVPKRVLMTVGRHVDVDALGPLPANVRVERWVDQGDVMPHAAAMVGHGGSGGTLAALAAGVPLAFMPQFVDGPANAARVTELGAGIVVEDDVAGAVHELLNERSYREAAERVADTMRSLPPVEAALELFSRSAGSAAR